MPRLVTVSRAAKLVGVSRGSLQRRIQDGDIESFEGMVHLGDVSKLYPETNLEDNSILERLEKIIEHAAKSTRSRTTTVPPDMETLAARVNTLSEELVDAKLEVSIFHNIVDKLKSRLNKIATNTPTASKPVHELQTWLLNEIEAMADKKFQSSPLLATDTFLRIMAAQVRNESTGHEFLVEGSNSILESGLSAGLALNYGCSNGNCGKCKARLINGDIKKIRNHDYTLSEKDKLQGNFLTCSNTAITDITIEADEAGNEADIPTQHLSAWVRKTTDAGSNICILNLKTPRTQRLRFLAGQKVKLEIPDIALTELHIASCPCDDMNLQFHIVNTKGNAFNNYIYKHIKNNDVINVEGPAGHFVLHEDEPSPIIFIAFGTGFAPVKSLIEHAVTLDVTEQIYLYRVVPTKEDLYLHNLCRSWNDAFERFNYSAITGNKNVVDTIISEHNNLPDYHYYIAGAANSIEETKNALVKQGAKQDSIITESVSG